MNKNPRFTQKGSGYMWMALALFLAGMTNVFIRPTVNAMVAHDDEALSDTLRLGVICLGIIALIVIGFVAAVLPGWFLLRRVRVVGGLNEGGSAYSGRFNTDLKRVFHASGAADALRGVSFTFTATQQGVSFWTGVRNPRLFLRLPWSRVHGFSAGQIELGGRIMSTVSIASSAPDGASISFSFVISSETMCGLFPRQQAEIEQIVSELNTLGKTWRASLDRPHRDDRQDLNN